jgi:hypothetical protein
MAIQTGLEGKPWYFGAATGAALAAALIAASWYLLVTPRNKEIAAKTKQLDALQGQINEGRAAKQKLPQFREECDAWSSSSRSSCASCRRGATRPSSCGAFAS